MLDKYQNLIKNATEEAVIWRRYLHAHPETAFEEIQTSEFIKKILKDLEIPFDTSWAKTGIIAKLEVQNPIRRLAFRAEMDALSIQEVNDIPYKSIYPGKMHACGHDGHMAGLLGAAKVLSFLKKQNLLRNSIYFIFQPAEENEGGAKKMIEEGFSRNYLLDAIYAVHNWPELEFAKFGLKKGAIMADYRSFTIEFEGKGSHAAMPHLGNDLIFIASLFIQNIYATLSRTNPLKSKVLSFTTFHAGNTYNVLPDKIEIKGTIRTFDEITKQNIIQLIESFLKNLENIYQIKINFQLNEGYPATVNYDQEIDNLEKIIKETFGQDQIVYVSEPSMGSEDFSYFLNYYPGAYIWLGSNQKNGCFLHNPKFNFSDNLLEILIRFWVSIATYHFEY